jgi:KAP-like P-loop domain-containing protein
VFVLAMDTEQLSHSVKVIYGEGFEAAKYLRRFIDLEFQLPEPSRDAMIEALYDAECIDGILAATGSVVDSTRKIMIRAAQLLAPIFKFSLRDVVQVFHQVALALRMIDPAALKIAPCYPILMAMLKSHDEGAFQDFHNGTHNVDRLLSPLREGNKGRTFLNDEVGLMVEWILDQQTLGPERFVERWQLVRNSVERSNSSVGDINIALKRLNATSDMIEHPLHKATIEALEFTANFVSTEE